MRYESPVLTAQTYCDLIQTGSPCHQTGLQVQDTTTSVSLDLPQLHVHATAGAPVVCSACGWSQYRKRRDSRTHLLQCLLQHSKLLLSCVPLGCFLGSILNCCLLHISGGGHCCLGCQQGKRVSLMLWVQGCLPTPCLQQLRARSVPLPV